MNLAAVRLIAWREISQRLRARAFRVSTAIVSTALVLGVLLPALLGGDGDDEPGPAGDPVGVVVAGEVDPAVATAIVVAGHRGGTRVEVTGVPDRAAAEAALRDGTAEIAVLPGGVVSAEPAGMEGPRLATAIAATVAQARVLSAAGLDAGTVEDALVAEPLEVSRSDGGEADADDRWILANLGAVFVYATLLMYGAWMVNGIIEEKANRVVELLLATVRPRDLMAGKILGLGAVGIIQTVAIFVPALVVGTVTESVVMPPGAGRASLVILLWWLLGYLLYAVLAAGAGALVSRSEESQVALTPVTLLLVVSYFASFAALASPDGTFATVASMIPFSAPVTMLVRMIVSQVPWWQVGVAAAGTLTTAALLTLLAARIYAGGLLRTGRRMTVRQAWASAED
ncbi:MAG: ABC transporter permease [Actinobacteria bacterium]|nr:ABC transporter permease [Actinomycetota bacterium]